ILVAVALGATVLLPVVLILLAAQMDPVGTPLASFIAGLIVAAWTGWSLARWLWFARGLPELVGFAAGGVAGGVSVWFTGLTLAIAAGVLPRQFGSASRFLEGGQGAGVLLLMTAMLVVPLGGAVGAFAAHVNAGQRRQRSGALEQAAIRTPCPACGHKNSLSRLTCKRCHAVLPPTTQVLPSMA